MTDPVPPAIGGYVLAGGRSSRMGSDKAILPLAGKPLIAHAVAKLRRVCADVHILSSNPALAAYAPIVPDLHPSCGPIGGLEAALTHSAHPWNLFLAVDMPFLPTAFIANWLAEWSIHPQDPARIRIFIANSFPQPGFCLIHQEILPYISESIARSDYKLMRVFANAGRELAVLRTLPPAAILWTSPATLPPHADCPITQSQLAAQHLWFANLNTPDDFGEAGTHISALDP